MYGEPVKFLKLSTNPINEADALDNAPRVIEDFLEQLDGTQQDEVLRSLLDSSSLVEKYGEEAGRELAAYRLCILLEAVGEAASELSGIVVTDISQEYVMETDTLTALTTAATTQVN